MLERFGTLLPAVLAGVHFITCGGTLEATMTESHPLMLLDDAMCGMALRLARGIEVNEDTLAVNLIKEVGWKGHYLAQPHTSEHCRREHFRSRLLRRDTRQTWEGKGSKTALDLARERVREILGRHQPRALDAALEKELQDYVAMVRQRSLAHFEAAEWAD